MVLLSAGDYQRKEKDKNGKFRLRFSDWWKIMLLVSLIIIGIAEARLTLKVTAEEAQANTNINIVQDKKIEVIQNDIKTIKADMSDVKTSQQENQKLLWKILGKLEQ